MQLKKFTGFSIENDSAIPLRKWVGISVETIENLFIQVRNGSGKLLKCTIVVISGGQVQGEYTSNPLNLYVENSANLTIEARAINHNQKTQTVLHGGDGFYKTVVFNLDRASVSRIDIN